MSEKTDIVERLPKQGLDLSLSYSEHLCIVQAQRGSPFTLNIDRTVLGELWAARIVHCVNLHDELVEALSGFLDDKRFDVFIGGNPIVVEDFLDRARSVLKKARGEA